MLQLVSMKRRKLTSAEEKASSKWRRSKRSQCRSGRVAGHVPDAAAGGPAVPNDWMDQLKSTNGYVGGIIGRLPLAQVSAACMQNPCFKRIPHFQLVTTTFVFNHNHTERIAGSLMGVKPHKGSSQ